jgi:hypothetical protein
MAMMISSTFGTFFLQKISKLPTEYNPLASQIQAAEQHRENFHGFDGARVLDLKYAGLESEYTAVPGKPMTQRRRRTPRGSRAG